MLTVLENFLLIAVSPALPTTTKVVAGMMQPPSATECPLVNVIANKLQTLSIANNDENKRNAAFFNQRINLTGDSKKLDFSLPNNVNGDILEVELTTGRLAKPRDDYWQDGQLLHFYQAPSTAFSVLVKDKPARGYQELTPCTVNLSIEVWGDTLNTTDNLLSPALAATLTALTELDRIELARLDNAGFSLRLLKPIAELSGLERHPTTNSTLFCSTAQLLLRGELEMTLALGTPAPQGIIQIIEGHLQNTSNPSSAENFKIKKPL
jgi:uncharacterized ubiquitin-like protein YukD